MRGFNYKNAESVQEAASWLSRFEGKAVILAGGTDLLGKLKGDILPRSPEALINIKRIRDLDFIKEDQEGLKIGAATRLHDIAGHGGIKEGYTALSLAALKTASPNIRQMATIGGNICQDIRCWYYRNPRNRFPCLRKGGGRCYAIEGDNRYHSIFGGSVEGGCYAVHPSDTAPALIALDASIKTSKRVIKAEDFFAVGVSRTTVLEPEEIVTEITIPRSGSGIKSSFMKFAMRSSIDFPIVNCAAMLEKVNGRVKSARICLNAVFVKPYRAIGAEKVIHGKAMDETLAELAGEAAVLKAKPMKFNRYMVSIAKSLVSGSLQACW
jgi:xanthine dehydrogenase YagS FAD-binding subunit